VTESVASKLVRLAVGFPCAGQEDGQNFALELPAELSELSYQTVVAHIEFRRKCMNQGFDNLLELLAMSKKTLVKAEEIVAANEPTDQPKE